MKWIKDEETEQRFVLASVKLYEVPKNEHFVLYESQFTLTADDGTVGLECCRMLNGSLFFDVMTGPNEGKRFVLPINCLGTLAERLINTRIL